MRRLSRMYRAEFRVFNHDRITWLYDFVTNTTLKITINGRLVFYLNNKGRRRSRDAPNRITTLTFILRSATGI